MKIFTSLSILFVLCGCSPEPIVSGIVRDKWIEHAHTVVVPEVYLDVDGDPHTRFVTDHVPEKLMLQFQSEGQTRSLSVDRAIFDSYNVGDRFEMVPAEVMVTRPSEVE